MDRIIRNLATLHPRITDDASRIGFLVILQSRRCPSSYWMFSFSPYKLDPQSIQAAFWWGAQSDKACATRTDQRSFERKYRSGLWVPISIIRLSLESTRIPYEYCVAFHPEEILALDEQGDIVGIHIYHRDRIHRSIATKETPQRVNAEATLRTWITRIPSMLHSRRMKHITQQIECHPPNHTGSFPGGIQYQTGVSSFNTMIGQLNRL